MNACWASTPTTTPEADKPWFSTARPSTTQVAARRCDLGVSDIERATVDPEVAERLQRALRILNGEEDDPNSSDEETKVVFADSVRLTHRGSSGDVDLDPEDESEGTMVWVGLIGPVLDVLDGGHVLLVDENNGEAWHPYEAIIKSGLSPIAIADIQRMCPDIPHSLEP